MTAPLTGAALAAEYNALRERAAHIAESIDLGGEWGFGELEEFVRRLAALPPLPVADVPEVGSLVNLDEVCQFLRVEIGETFEEPESSLLGMGIERALLARFRPAPEGGE